MNDVFSFSILKSMVLNVGQKFQHISLGTEHVAPESV